MRQAVLIPSALTRLALPLAALLAGVAAAAPDGKALFTANCAGCHQATGQGVPGAFPPLAGHVPDLLAAPEGRAYVARVVLYGLQGQISVKGKTYNGVMPAFGQLSDAQLAAVLNSVSTSWGNKLPKGQKPFTAAELTRDRQAKKTPTQVHALRPKTVK